MPLAGEGENGSIVKSHGPLFQSTLFFEHTTGESRKQLAGWEGGWILAATALGSKSPNTFIVSARDEPCQRKWDEAGATNRNANGFRSGHPFFGRASPF
jgi:hypothetical protein